MKKKVTSLFVVLALIVSVLPSTIFAANGELTGSGTLEAPYLIEDIADLMAFRDKVNGGERTISAKLLYDIDLNNTEWTPIGGNDGYATSYYGGTFDGNGKTISNLKISASYNFAGFFSYLKENAYIKNLHITNADITSSKNNVGGIAGTIINGTIENSSFAGSVKNTKTSSGYAGGIAGYVGSTNTTKPTVSGCVNYGEISGPYAGGITGYAKFANPISNCYNTGKITGTTRSAGIVGQNMNNTSIENCYNIGDIEGSNIGAISGFNGVSAKNCYWIKPDSGFGGGTGSSENCEKITSAEGLAALLGEAFTEDEGNINSGYPILLWQKGSSEIQKIPHITIDGNTTLIMTNDATLPSTTLTVKYIDMSETPEVVWDIESGTDIISLENPENTNKSIVVRAKKAGKATVTVKTTDDTYSADCEISVLPFITTVEIEGTVAVGEKVYAHVNILGGEEYDYDNYPSLQFQWRYLTNEDYTNANTGSSAYKTITGATNREYIIPEEYEGEYLSFSFFYDGQYKEPSRPVKIMSANEAVVAKDKAALSIDTSDVKESKSIALPQNGKNGSTITWESANTSIISENGNVTLPNEGIKTVKLTATLSYSGITAKKEFSIKVYSQKAAEEENANILLQLEQAIASLGEFYKIYPQFGKDTNVIEILKKDLQEKGYDKTDISIKNIQTIYDGGEISENGDITYFYRDPNTTPAIRMASFNITFTLSEAEVSKDFEVPVIVYWDRDKVKEAMKAEISDFIDADTITAEGDTLESITKNLTLPKVTDNKKWTEISWQSSNEKVITVSAENQTTADTLFEPYIGKIKPGRTDETVTLTATFTFMLTNDITGAEEPITTSKVFEVTVKALTNNQIAEIEKQLEEKLNSGFDSVGLSDSVTGEPLDENNEIFTAYNDIKLPTTHDFGVDGKFYPVTISSDNEDVIKTPDVNNAALVEILRPAVGSSDATAKITVSMIDKDTNISASKTFNILIPALTQAEIDAEKALMEKVKAAYFDGIKGENTEADNISKNLSPFLEVYEKDGELIWVRNSNDTVNYGIVPVAIDGWERLEAWRLFKSSNPAAVTHETLFVTIQSSAKAVTVSSALSSENFGKYGKLYKEDPITYSAYADLADLYYQEVSKDLIIRGKTTKASAKPVAVQETVNVSFTLKSDTDTLINQTKYTNIDETLTVFDIFERALAENGYTYDSKGTYVSAITSPDGTTLREFDKGDYSGWLYKVNGELPNVSMAGYGLSDGDKIVVYYTTDYFKEFDVKTYSSGVKSIGTAKEQKNTEENDQSSKNQNTDQNTDQNTPDDKSEIQYSDISGHWAEDAIRYVSKLKIMQGVGEGNFAPDRTLNRAMFVTILYRLENEPESEASDFSDVEKGSWYEKAVSWASKNGIINGISETTFAPYNDITREQMAVILYRYAKFKGFDITTSTALEYADNTSISDYSKDAVLWAAENGIMQGNNDNFAPLNNSTRAQAAMVIMRAIENLK